MAPSVLATSTGTTSSNTTFHGVVTSTSAATMGVQAGDGLVAFVSIDEAPSVSATPGWTIANQLASGTVVTGVVVWKIADAVDDHLTITTGTSQMASWIVYRCDVEGSRYFDGGVGIAVASGVTLNNDNWAPANGLTLQRLVFATRHADASSISSTPPSAYWDNGTSVQHTNAQGASTQVGPEVFVDVAYNPGSWAGVSPAGAAVGFTCGWAPVLSIAATGAATSGGSAALTAKVAAAATGAATSGGAAAVTDRMAAAATGAATSTGSATVTAKMAAAATGAATSAGTAALGGTVPVAATGAAASAGSAAVTARMAADAAGAAASGGSAAVTAKMAAGATGAASSAGTAAVTDRMAAAATGAASSAGTASLTARRSLAATGAAASAGTAVLGRLQALTATGGAGSLGAANATVRLAFQAVGIATSGGHADFVAPFRLSKDLDVTVDPTVVIAQVAAVGPTIIDTTIEATVTLAQVAAVAATALDWPTPEATALDWPPPAATVTDWTVGPIQITRG